MNIKNEEAKQILKEHLINNRKEEDKNIFLYVYEDLIYEIENDEYDTSENINNLFKIYESENANGSVYCSSYKDLKLIKNHLHSIYKFLEEDEEAQDILRSCIKRNPGIETAAVVIILQVLDTILYNIGLEREEEETEETKEIKNNIYIHLLNNYIDIYYNY